jgi:hypothetical protein
MSRPAQCRAALVNPFFTAGEMERLLTGIVPEFLVRVAGIREVATRLAAKLDIENMLDMNDADWSITDSNIRA